MLLCVANLPDNQIGKTNTLWCNQCTLVHQLAVTVASMMDHATMTVMEIQVVQFESAGTYHQANEYNEAWSLMDEENYRREICERLDLNFDALEIDSDGIPF